MTGHLFLVPEVLKQFVALQCSSQESNHEAEEHKVEEKFVYDENHRSLDGKQ